MLCVATVDGGLDAHDYGLKAAFASANAGAEGTTWDIRLRPGVYQLSQDLIFHPDGSHDNKKFQLRGGWDGTCSNETGLAKDTIIRGVASAQSGYSTNFTFWGDNASYDIEYVRFENFREFYLDDQYCLLFEICPDTDAVYIEHDEFSNGGDLNLHMWDAHEVVFRNNLVTNLFGDPYGGGPFGITVTANEDPPQIAFNTFADLNCPSGTNGVLLFSGNSHMALHHNVVQANGCTYDVYIATKAFKYETPDQFKPQHVTPYFNLFGSIGGNFDGDIFANGNQDTYVVKFADPLNGNYRLQDTSPAVNTGATQLEAIAAGLVYSPVDLDGKQRPYGQHFDLGAYESNKYDGTPPDITVNSANDVDDGICNATHCSLREAINRANALSSDPQHIVFNIPGSCPRAILLNAPLPDITGRVTIDGYTQPGANVNDLEYGSDANICILLSPSVGGVGYALQVPAGQPDSTQLNVRGLAFGSGFAAFSSTGAAIELRSGSGHRIVGNAFGGYLPSTLAPIGSLARAVFVLGTAKNAHIGTTEPADRNYLGSLSENAIVLNNATAGDFIENNYIGVRPDGVTAQANQNDGISASGGSDVTINRNTIAASYWGISLLGVNTKAFTVTSNRIGLNALGIPNATLSNHAGIVIGLGSDGHFIGAKASDQLSAGKTSNFIANNLGDGILLSADAGPANAIRGNAIFSNGKGGGGIGIDLDGSLTQLANDAGDADTGANALQNYPVISGSSPTDATHRQVHAMLNTAANQTVRIDFYQSPTCGGATGANATNFVGSTDVVSGATGIVAVAATIAEAGKAGYLTATATIGTDALGTGRTSELAPCVAEDVIFRHGAE